MATVTGMTAERMQEIEDESIVNGVVTAGHLILSRHDGTPIDAGSVIGPPGPQGPPPGNKNGQLSDLYLAPVLGNSAMMVKHGVANWGLSTTYGEDQLLELLSDSDRDAGYSSGNAGGVITAVSNTTPIQVTVGAGHTYLTGDTSYVLRTGIAAIDLKCWKLTKISPTVVSLDYSVASGVATLTANSVLWGDPNPILSRLDAWGGAGLSTGLHVAPGLRGFSGQAFPPVGGGGGSAIWIQPHVDMPGVMVWNSDRVSNPQALVSPMFGAFDAHSVIARSVWLIEQDGVQSIRRQSGKADTAVLLRLLKDDDSGNLLEISAGGGIWSKGISSFGSSFSPIAGITMIVSPPSASGIALDMVAQVGQSGPIWQWGDPTGFVVYGGANKDGHPFTRKTVIPVTADMLAGELIMWLDATPGATKAMFKAKDSAGTVRTASVALA